MIWNYADFRPIYFIQNIRDLLFIFESFRENQTTLQNLSKFLAQATSFPWKISRITYHSVFRCFLLSSTNICCFDTFRTKTLDTAAANLYRIRPYYAYLSQQSFILLLDKHKIIYMHKNYKYGIFHNYSKNSHCWLLCTQAPFCLKYASIPLTDSWNETNSKHTV